MTEINFDKILEDIKPSAAEVEKVKLLSNGLINIIDGLAAENGINAEAMLVGSVAKGTWLSGKAVKDNADIDLLIKFPLTTSLNDLKRCGLFLGEKCIEMVKGYAEKRYASHPYVTGHIDGYDIDFVPCYSIKDARQLKSAVDRTLLHTLYIQNKLKNEKKDEVRLLKKFMESVGTYGSEFKVGGFAGYLCELLILYYGSFQDVLNAAATRWHPHYQIDLEKYGTAELFKEPLVVVDPVDKKRNVAAPLTQQKMSEFMVAAYNFTKNPSQEYFYPKKVEHDLNLIKEEFKKRGTHTVLLIFKPPSIPADAIYPQIKKTENSLVNLSEREDFKVFGSDFWTDEKKKVIILLEFDTWKLPTIKKHSGPFVWSKNHQDKFLNKYKEKAWIENDRWVVGVQRKHEEVQSLIETALTRGKIGYLRFGKHLKNEILKKYEMMDLMEFLESEEVGDDVLGFLYHYLYRSELLWR